MNLEQQWNEVSVKHVNNVKLLRQVRAKQARARRERTTRRAELQELSVQTGPVFRSVGKAFLLANKQDLEKEATTVETNKRKKKKEKRKKKKKKKRRER